MRDDADFFCDRLGGGRVVARQHVYLDTRAGTLRYGGCGLAPRRVVDPSEAEKSEVALDLAPEGFVIDIV